MKRLFVVAALVAAAVALNIVARADSTVGLTVTTSPLVISSPGVYDGGGATIDVGCASDHNVEINASGVTLRNYTLLNANESAVRIGERSGVVIEDVAIKGFNCADGGGQYRAGVACWGCTALTVQNSHIETARTFGDGIWVKNYGIGTGSYIVRGNTIVGGFDGIGGEPEDQPYGGLYRNALIEDNTVTGCADDGIQVEGGNVNVRVQDNTIDGCGIGVAFAPNLTGPLYVERNVIRNLRTGYYGGLACFKVGDGGVGTAYVQNNVCTTEGDGFKQTNPGLSIIIARGNCIQVTRYVIETLGDFPIGVSFDSDRLWSTDPQRFIKWGGTLYGSLSSFRVATEQEPNGIEAQGCAEPPAESTPTPEPTPTPTSTPAATPTATPIPTPEPSTCEVLVRIDGVIQWVTKDEAFCR